MTIESTCTGCGKTLSVADENAGKRARCPACGQIYTIPPKSDTPATNSADSSAYSVESSVPPEADRYWMRAVDGSEYGPIDQATLDRWFREGRVGPGYQLRQSQYGNWQPADVFRPTLPPRSDNPFAETSSAGNQSYDPTSGRPNYPKGDQSVLILIMGVLGFFCCPIFGVVAWIMGHSALNAIQSGLADPSTKGLVQTGYYLGIAAIVKDLLCWGGPLLKSLFG
ncbi:MAG: hypothetical protein ABI557_07190 [Aureliella sp.]